jgi:hypothetical protein
VSCARSRRSLAASRVVFIFSGVSSYVEPKGVEKGADDALGRMAAFNDRDAVT